MRRVLAAAWLTVAVLAGWGRSADDYLLPKEDTLLRDAEGFELRSYYRLRVVSRRIDALECRHRPDQAFDCGKRRDRDPLMSALDERSDERLLRDYREALRVMLLNIEDVFASHRGRVVEKVLLDLKKQADHDIEVLDAIEAGLKEPAELRTAWEQARSLALKAAAGARKGLERISR